MYQVVGNASWYFIQTAPDTDDDIDDGDDTADDDDDTVEDDDDNADDDDYFDDDFVPDLGLCIYINQPENLMLVSDNLCFASAPYNSWDIEGTSIRYSCQISV